MRRLLLALCTLSSIAGAAYAAPCTQSGSLVRALTTVRGKHELAVFVFRQPADVRYTIEATSPPFFEDPSEQPIAVAGDAFTKVTFQNVNWMCEIAEAFSTPRKAITDIKRTSQFEGMVGYVIGRSAASHFISTYQYDTKASRVFVVKFRR